MIARNRKVSGLLTRLSPTIMIPLSLYGLVASFASLAL
jgi:hypothetical protein